jgi:hypothetical protein
MGEAFKRTAASKNANLAGAELATQMKRLVASDVIWEDFFKEPTKTELGKLGITGANVPDSTFLPNSDIATTTSMKAVWQRIHGSSPGGSTCSPRGTGIVSTKVLPSGKALSPTTTNTIQVSLNLGFAVTVQNSGCGQEVGLHVRLTIQRAKPITQDKTILIINPGEEKTVEFKNIPQPPLDQKTNLTIEVDPVPSETKTDNNHASYPVQFAIG